MIRLVQMTNFKGFTGDIELTGKDLFYGPNGSGKSRIVEAIEFGIFGSIGNISMISEIHNEYGMVSNYDDVSEYEPLEVALVFDDQTVITRKITYAKEKFSSDITIFDGAKKITGKNKCNAWIETNINPLALAFKFDEFLRKTSTDRRKDIQDILTVKSPNKAEIAEHLVKNNIPDEYIKELNAVTLDVAIDDAEEKRKYWNAIKTETQGAAQFIAKARVEETANVKLKDKLENSLNESNTLYMSTSNELAVAKQTNRDIESEKAKLPMYEKRLQEAYATDYDRLILDKQAELVELKSRKFKLKELDTERLDQLMAENDTLKEEVGALNESYGKHGAERLLKQQSRTSKQAELDNFDANTGTCPITGHKCTIDMSKHRNSLVKAIETLSSEIEAITDSMSEIDEQLDKAQQKKREATEEYNQLATFHNEAVERNNRLAEKEVDTKHRIELAEKDLTRLQSELKNSTVNINAIREMIHNIKSLELVDTESLEAQNKASYERVQEIREQLKAIDEKVKTIDMHRKSADDHIKAEKNWKAWKDIKDLLDVKGLKGQLMASALNPLENKINSNLEEMGIESRVYFSMENAQGKQEFKFGWISEGKKQPRLSNGEMLLTSVGMLKAFQEHTGGMSFLIINELMLLDEDRRKALLSLKTLDFDNVIILAPTEVECYNDLVVTSLA